ncbi:MAG TPA: hypothetical protein VFX82_07125 [Desulfobacterales bacterium]|nr:hypothetical protein [Desulfobacterales bacterium]
MQCTTEASGLDRSLRFHLGHTPSGGVSAQTLAGWATVPDGISQGSERQQALLRTWEHQACRQERPQLALAVGDTYEFQGAVV